MVLKSMGAERRCCKHACDTSCMVVTKTDACTCFGGGAFEGVSSGGNGDQHPLGCRRKKNLSSKLPSGVISKLPFFWGGGVDSKCSRVLKIVLGNWATQVCDTLDPC